ncbi:hypothetical protein HPO_00545 [Hyphomonas polymorpha PS728]|uniref:Saccharopine dehydrogenase n=1 Tax=Hyphomonas polymorpha PS728 TaxID=1280954 RepID=A0A062VLA4_9PROT|nr:SDR family oxidoreductase [Hyphomonas polymorpha]KDA00472.1 hypothetical protein HPO_00545 [Hyphomonas polymorpha PS728]
MNRRILIIGGYGVFGGRLARALVRAGYTDVVVAGRNLAAAEAFCREAGGTPAQLDTDTEDFSAQVAALAPAILIDAAGPWQAYGNAPYAIAQAAIACGAHYLDLSDDAAFTAGIATLDADAAARGLTVLSGVSSVPGLSSAAVEALAAGLSEIALIDTVILPGNRAPRGKSVIRSILSQTGKPLEQREGDQWKSVNGWGSIRSVTLETPGTAPLKGRWASPIGAPDLRLMPGRYGAASVRFSAGLDLKLMHGGLWALGQLVSLRLIRSLESWTGLLKWVAERLAAFGSDRGGMGVEVTGFTAQGTCERRSWTLIAEAGDGPDIPAVPARIMAGKILAGETLPGARACLGAFSLAEAEAALKTLRVTTAQTAAAQPMVFAAAMGDEFGALPVPLKTLHRVAHVHHWRGEADITRGGGLLSRMAGALAGFPPAGRAVPVLVTMQRTRTGETWTRQFGARKFRSHLRRATTDPAGMVRERFGVMEFAIPLTLEGARLAFPVHSGRVFGVPLPRFLLPVSETYESVTGDGACQFDVSIRLPMIGLVAHYRGWLKPALPTP